MSETSVLTPHTLVVGAGPAGSAAALALTRSGLDTLLIDATSFPRDKTCGDGLTPRAMHQLRLLGLEEEVTSRYTSRGLKLHGYGGSVEAPWPDSEFGQVGSAMPRTEFDALLLRAAEQHATFLPGEAAVGVTGSADFPHCRIEEVTLSSGTRVRPQYVVVADGVRSTFGKLLGRTWHKEEVYGIAARSYCTTPRSEEPWIHSHLELRDSEGTIQPGYGWIFPLGNGEANVGCGALSTTARPAKLNTKKLLGHYAASCSDWGFGQPRAVTSALLPMGGAVSNIAGSNYALIGDAAACVNPLNGEGIDYALETAAMVAELIAASESLTAWPSVLRETYGEAFALARSAARLLTYPKFLPLAGPIGLGRPFGSAIMPVAARLMGNLVPESDRDLIARAWRVAGKAALRANGERPLWS